MRNVPCTLPGNRPATVSFISRYLGENDYELWTPRAVGRVAHDTNTGRIRSKSPEYTQADAEAAVKAHAEAEHRQYLQFRADNSHLFTEGT